MWIHQMKKKKKRVCGPSILPAPSQLPPTPSQDQTEPLLSETIPTAYPVTSGLLRDKDHVPKEAFHPSSNPDALKQPRFSLETCWLWGRLTWGPSAATPSSPAALFLDFAFFSFPSSRSLSSRQLSLCGCPVVSNCSRPHGLCLSVEFSRQESWSGLSFPPPGDFPDPGIEPISPTHIFCVSDSLPAEPLMKPWSLRISEKSSFFF